MSQNGIATIIILIAVAFVMTSLRRQLLYLLLSLVTAVFALGLHQVVQFLHR